MNHLVKRIDIPVPENLVETVMRCNNGVCTWKDTYQRNERGEWEFLYNYAHTSLIGLLESTVDEVFNKDGVYSYIFPDNSYLFVSGCTDTRIDAYSYSSVFNNYRSPNCRDFYLRDTTFKIAYLAVFPWRSELGSFVGVQILDISRNGFGIKLTNREKKFISKIARLFATKVNTLFKNPEAIQQEINAYAPLNIVEKEIQSAEKKTAFPIASNDVLLSIGEFAGTPYHSQKNISRGRMLTALNRLSEGMNRGKTRKMRNKK